MILLLTLIGRFADNTASLVTPQTSLSDVLVSRPRRACYTRRHLTAMLFGTVGLVRLVGLVGLAGLVASWWGWGLWRSRKAGISPSRRAG